MKKEYDFSKMKRRRNPYAKRLKRQVTMRIGVDVIEYFKKLAEETGIPYQKLIDMYLRECVERGRRPSLKWVS
jgi:predicted DNA binding CopG/RHH family protein